MTGEFICTQCGHMLARYVGKCPGCNAWGTIARGAVVMPAPIPVVAPIAMRSPVHAMASDLMHAPAPTEPAGIIETDDLPNAVPITSVDLSEIEDRYTTGIEPLDRVLGGGFVLGAPVLLCAEPGAGKSSLILQAGGAFSKWHELPVLYAAGEESIPMIAARAKRLGALHDQLLIVRETNPIRICALAARHHVGLAIVDSVNTAAMPDRGAPGSMQQISACGAYLSDFAHETEIILVLIGQVNKNGVAAGPKTLEHAVDVFLELDKPEHGNRRTLYARKNRHGSTDEIGRFRMTHRGLIPDDDSKSGELVEGEDLPIHLEDGAPCGHLYNGDRCELCGHASPKDLAS